VEEQIQSVGFPSTSIFRPAAIIGTPHTPKWLAWLSPKIDGVVPAKYKSSDIDTLAAAMVYDAEQRLDALDGPNSEKQAENSVVFYEGGPLHSLYGEIPFKNGLSVTAEGKGEL
jgi:hypothetical protein